MKEKLRIVFYGTPDFAVASLDILVKNDYAIIAVITAPDKPAGRGLGLQQSAIKKYALSKSLKVLQPVSMKDPEFLKQLKELNLNLQVVVAFRMMPESVWGLPMLGTFNLHASLLPQYRGAAPINRVIMNGEKETGVTTFFLKQEIDAGKIIYRAKVKIEENETAGELHDKLMQVGSELVLRTVRDIECGNFIAEDQSGFTNANTELKAAPKIFKDDCKINWRQDVDQIHNHIRGLSPYPAAWTELISENGEVVQLKIYHSIKEQNPHNLTIGTIEEISVPEKKIRVAVKEGFVILDEVQLAGRKRMKVSEFLKGFSFEKYKLNF